MTKKAGNKEYFYPFVLIEATKGSEVEGFELKFKNKKKYSLYCVPFESFNCTHYVRYDQDERGRKQGDCIPSEDELHL